MSKSDVYSVQDELWVYCGIVRTKNNSKTWLKKDAKRQQHLKLIPQKMMLMVLFTCRPARFSVTALPKGETATADYMVEYLKGNWFHDLINKKDRIAIKNLFHMDNGGLHSVERTQMYLGMPAECILSSKSL